MQGCKVSVVSSGVFDSGRLYTIRGLYLDILSPGLCILDEVGVR